MGTSQDMLDLMGGDENKLAALETAIADHLGFARVFNSVGQIYPRTLDFDAVSALVELGASPSSLATTIRLMAGNETVTEGFKEGEVGSSAMPHKMNASSCVRVGGLKAFRLSSDYSERLLDFGSSPCWTAVERRRRILLRGSPRCVAGRFLRHRWPV